eukprot:1743356-Rhodomonas_salina.1
MEAADNGVGAYRTSRIDWVGEYRKSRSGYAGESTGHSVAAARRLLPVPPVTLRVCHAWYSRIPHLSLPDSA